MSVPDDIPIFSRDWVRGSLRLLMDNIEIFGFLDEYFQSLSSHLFYLFSTSPFLGVVCYGMYGG